MMRTSLVPAAGVLTLYLLNTFCVQTFPFVLAEEFSETGSGTQLTMTGAVMGSGSVIGTGSGSSSQALMPPEVQPLHVRINEVQWMGTDLSTADEWLEIVAVATGATVPVDLTGWTVTQMKDTGEAVVARLDGLSIGSGGYLIISNFPAATSRLKRPPDLVTSGMSLPNTKLLLRLRNDSGVLMDEVDDFVGAPFAGSNPSASSGQSPSGGIKASMERIDPLKQGTLKENWRTATTHNGIDKDAKVLGTPGFPNGSVELPDILPPEPVTKAYAYVWSGSVIVGWQPSASSDVLMQRVTIGNQLVEVGSSITEVVRTMTGGVTGVSIQSIDDSGNISPELLIQFQPLFKLKISELLSSPIAGQEEWVEIENSGDSTIDLRGISLESGSRTFSFKNIPGSGSFLQPLEYRMLPASLTGLQLPNAGGVVRLKAGGLVIQEVSYAGLPIGVSLSLSSEGMHPSCVPTPSLINTHIAPDPHIVIQDGSVNGTEPVTLNLALQTMTGSLEGATCHWDFGDGFTSESCNPPSHKMLVTGDGNISVQVHDYCGNTMERILPFSIISKPSALAKFSEEVIGDRCTPTTFSGITLSEFLADPEGDETAGEWIELRNISGAPSQLCGWSVDDQIGGSDPYPLDRFVVGSGEYLLLPRTVTDIALNNDRDTVRLIGPLPHGGTGTLMILPFQKSIEGKSMALRDDGQWIATPYLTPGTDNRFTEVDMTMGQSPVIISAAFPNPTGSDEFDEYIKLTNLTMYPQWLNGWVLENATGKQLNLYGNVIARKDSIIIKLRKTGFVLANTNGALKLIDESGTTRSVLAWQSAPEGKEVRPFNGEKVEAPSIDSIELAGISKPDAAAHTTFSAINYEYKNLISFLTKNKKVDLEIDTISTDSLQFYAWAEGVDVQSLLLRMGYAYVSLMPFARKQEYELYEKEAREQKRGIWADEQLIQLTEEQRERERLRGIYEREGLTLSTTPASGLVASGTLLTVMSNLPSDIFLAIGSGAYEKMEDGYRIAEDQRISFYAEIQSGSVLPEVVRSDVVTREYIIQKKFYVSCIKISEVYPSPLSGENEWIELENICDRDINLAGWIIDDQPDTGSKPYALGIEQKIIAHGYSLLSGSTLKVALNNGGDQVLVRTPAGNLSDSIIYGSVKKGLSFVRKENGTCISTKSTMAAPNECVLPVVKAKKAVSKTSSLSKLIGLGIKYTTLDLLHKTHSEYIENALMEGLNLNYRVQKLNNNGFYTLIVALAALGMTCLTVMRLIYRLWTKEEDRATH